MNTTSTTTEPNQYQLAVEADGADVEVMGPLGDGTWSIRSAALAQQDLDALVAAHIPDPAVVPPTPDPSADPQALIAATPPADLLMAVRAGADLAKNAGLLWQALVLMDREGEAFRPVEIVTDIALRAVFPDEEET